MEDRLIVDFAQAVLAENDRMAAALRAEFDRRGLFCVNVLSSPGAGKTALLERTLADLAGQIPTGVLVGDLATDHDAARLRGTATATWRRTWFGPAWTPSAWMVSGC